MCLTMIHRCHWCRKIETTRHSLWLTICPQQKLALPYRCRRGNGTFVQHRKSDLHPEIEAACAHGLQGPEYINSLYFLRWCHSCSKENFVFGSKVSDIDISKQKPMQWKNFKIFNAFVDYNDYNYQSCRFAYLSRWLSVWESKRSWNGLNQESRKAGRQ